MLEISFTDSSWSGFVGFAISRHSRGRDCPDDVVNILLEKVMDESDQVVWVLLLLVQREPTLQVLAEQEMEVCASSIQAGTEMLIFPTCVLIGDVRSGSIM